MGQVEMITNLIGRSLSLKSLLVAVPLLVLALASGGWYLHSQGYQQGYEKAELVCAEQREAGKDLALQELLRLQKEALEKLEQNRALNASINEEVRKKDEVVTNTIERIIEREPVVIRDDCTRPHFLSLFNDLATLSTSSDSDTGSSEGISDRVVD